MNAPNGRAFATLADAMPAELRGDGPPRGAEEHPRSPAHVSRPSRIPVYNPPSQAHALPPPEGPDRTLAVAGNDNEGPTVRKRKPRLPDTTPEQKAAAVAIALELRNDKKTLPEQAAEIKRRLGFEPSPSALSQWVIDAKDHNQKQHVGDDLQSLSRRLIEIAAETKQIKARMRHLLGGDDE